MYTIIRENVNVIICWHKTLKKKIHSIHVHAIEILPDLHKLNSVKMLHANIPQIAWKKLRKIVNLLKNQALPVYPWGKGRGMSDWRH